MNVLLILDLGYSNNPDHIDTRKPSPTQQKLSYERDLSKIEEAFTSFFKSPFRKEVLYDSETNVYSLFSGEKEYEILWKNDQPVLARNGNAFILAEGTTSDIFNDLNISPSETKLAASGTPVYGEFVSEVGQPITFFSTGDTTITGPAV